MIFVNQGDVLHLHRMGKNGQACFMLAQGAAQKGHVQAVNVQGNVGQGVIGNQVQGDISVAQCQVQIDQRDIVVRIELGEIAAKVDGQARAADAAARTDN